MGIRIRISLKNMYVYITVTLLATYCTYRKEHGIDFLMSVRSSVRMSRQTNWEQTTLLYVLDLNCSDYYTYRLL